MQELRENIVVYGGGYIGLVTAAGLAELGHHVSVREIDVAKAERLARGEVPNYELGLEELLTRNRLPLRFTADVDEALADAAVAGRICTRW